MAAEKQLKRGRAMAAIDFGAQHVASGSTLITEKRLRCSGYLTSTVSHFVSSAMNTVFLASMSTAKSLPNLNSCLTLVL